MAAWAQPPTAATNGHGPARPPGIRARPHAGRRAVCRRPLPSPRRPGRTPAAGTPTGSPAGKRRCAATAPPGRYRVDGGRVVLRLAGRRRVGAFHHQDHAYDTDTLIEAPGELRAFLGGQKAALVWDGLPVHRSQRDAPLAGLRFPGRRRLQHHEEVVARHMLVEVDPTSVGLDALARSRRRLSARVVDLAVHLDEPVALGAC
jgi:hypothetical protein